MNIIWQLLSWWLDKQENKSGDHGSQFFDTNYDVGFDGKPVPGSGDDGIDEYIQTNVGIGGNIDTPPYDPDQAGSSDPGYPGNDEDINEILDNSPTLSNASIYGKMQGSTVEEKLKWLIDNDPENATSWVEQLLGLQGSRESLSEAREYEKFMQDTRIQRTAKDLEAAGINPILAYQFLSNGSSGLGSAGYPDSNVATTAASRANTGSRNSFALITALIAAMALIAKAAL